MSSLPSIYTPLESLLLFQALRIAGVESSSFTRISDELKAVPLIRDDPSYDAARLDPDALRQLYLDLLKEEAKRDLERQLNGADTNGGVTSRKRKAPSPKLPSVQEAVQHSHLIPQLITRLYTRYRDITINQVREQEKKYEVVVREIDDIKAGKWDDDLQKHAAAVASAQTSPKMSVSALIQPENQVPKQKNAVDQNKRLSQARIDAVINHTPNDQAAHRRTSSGTVLPPLSEMAPHSPRYGIPPKMASGQYQPSSPAAYPPAHAHHVGSPQLHHPNRASASPRPILPPPSGMANSPLPGSPGVSTPTMHSPQQPYHPPNRVPAQQSQNNITYGRPYQLGQPPHLPTPPGYYQQQQQYPDRRTSYPHQPQQLPARPGTFIPQYQNNAYQQPQLPQHLQQYPVQYHQSQYMPNAPATGPRPQPAQRVIMSDVLRALTTPPRPLRQPVWKSEKRPMHGQAPGSPTRPVAEPLSPVLARAPSPVRRTQSIRTRKQKRESSVAASDVDSSTRHTRSVSIGSTANVTEDGLSKRKTKDEPFVADSEEPEPSFASSMVTRKRRGTLTQSSFTKRRRQYSTDAALNDEPPPRPTTVLATRNFSKMSAVIMNEINSHKHGSRFAQRVRDKDADGYSSFIKRPQDLKSIRAAITHGARAITAATTTADSPSAPPTPGGSKTQDSVVELDRTIDLIPPKAIVNGAQLEREIMRMFANAVMFNPGEDGMVADTREMFEDVEAKIAEWRGAERDLGTEDEEEGRAKRRKL